MRYNFFIVGGDERILHLAENLKEAGNNIKMLGFEKAFYTNETKENTNTLNDGKEETIDNKIKEKMYILKNKEIRENETKNNFNNIEIFEENNFKQANSLDEIEAVDIVISSAPLSLDNENVYAPFSNKEIPLDELKNHIKGNKFFAGKLTDEFKQLENSYDIFEDEKMTILNTISTAEGAIAKAIENTKITMDNANILVLGFGRVGKMLAKKLKALNANVYVEARKVQDLAWIEALGYNQIDLNELNENLCKMDIIFNTVPSLIMDKERLILLNRRILIIDLASKPGGVDFESTKKMKMNAILYSGIPGKVAPITVSKYIEDYILKILKKD